MSRKNKFSRNDKQAGMKVHGEFREGRTWGEFMEERRQRGRQVIQVVPFMGFMQWGAIEGYRQKQQMGLCYGRVTGC